MKPSPHPVRRRLAATGIGLALGAGLLVVGPATAAETDARPVDAVTGAIDVAIDDRYPAPDDHPTDRPDHDLEVLRLKCEAQPGEASDTRIHIGCRWRAAQSERAAGYQLWRIVDRGERELVARGGLDLTGARDVVSAEAHVVRYAVIAVDENGRRVGQSRVQKVVLHDDPPPIRRAAGRVLVH